MRPFVRAVAVLTGVVLSATMSSQPVFAGSTKPHRPPALEKATNVPVKTYKGTSTKAGAVPVVTKREATAWPATGVAEAEVSPKPAGSDERPVGTLPVRVGQPSSESHAVGTAVPSKVKVEILDKNTSTAAHREGVVLRVRRADGKPEVPGTVGLRMDYDAFRDAYGSDWASRLRFVALPECALTTPHAAECQGTPLTTRNDGVKSIRADVPLVPAPSGSMGRSVPMLAASSGAGALVAAEAGPAGSTGNYTATSLSPSSTWQAGSSSGGFSWSYPMRIPPVTGGPQPATALSYSSQSVDGRTAATNNQPSWIGEGFDLSQGFIERRYAPCSEDMAGSSATVKTGDQCWVLDNAVLSLGGGSIELVRDDTTGVWRTKIDDGSKIERMTGSANGDNDGEHWRLTRTDGTQYWFGLHRLPGWAAGSAETNSTWTVPVYGNHAGEPCQSGGYSTSWCMQAWRWNLDYVVDVHGNSMSLWYERETNRYGRNLDPSQGTDYTRGGWLTRVDYGTRTDAEFTTVPARVLFEVADRCLPNTACDPAVEANRTNWPDTPWDQWCQAGAACTGQVSPTFWSSKRLAKVRTQVWNPASTSFRDVDSWTLRHTYPEPGDGTRAGLWLAGITHSGLVGGTITDPEVTLGPVQMNNRVDAVDGRKPMNWSRLQTIKTESGGEITVGYSDRDCVPGSRMPSSPDTNILRCQPSYWTPEGASAPVLDWFHTYVVTTVVETDHTGGAPRVATRYEYLGDPAWHASSEDGITPAQRQTWGQWRGYERVRVRVGDGAGQTLSETRYLRGMDDDRLASGSRRDVWVSDSQGGRAEDSEPFAGHPLESITYSDATGATELSGSIQQPWQSAPTATRVVRGTTIHARYVGTSSSRGRTSLDGGRGYRYTSTATTYDTYGMPIMVADNGDESTPSDDRCTRTTYLRNPNVWLMATVSRVETAAMGCTAQPSSGEDIISESRTSFDGGEFGVAPTKGDTTLVEGLAEWGATGRRYIATKRTTFDIHGRAVASTDVKGGTNTTSYTPTTGGPVTQIVTTNALGHTSTVEVEPAWGSTVSNIDANGKRTDVSYDPSGKLIKVWLPLRPKYYYPSDPSISYTYQLRADGATVVTTKKIAPNNNFVTSYQLYDALLRPRQAQSPAEGGGRILTDTFYDSAGRATLAFGAYWNSGEPSGTLVTPGSQTNQVDPTLILNQTRTIYDGAGRATVSIFQPGGAERWRTSTAYGGDRVDVTPPTGGTATSTLTDAHGRKSELRQYHGTTPAGAYDSTRYAYDRKGQLSSITDHAGNAWTYAYDQRGRKTSTHDPDSGTTTFTYDDAGRLTSSTDARGITLAYTYDMLDRKTGLYEGSTSGVKRAEWTYDTLAKGHRTSSTRYVNGNAYTTQVRGYTDDYQSMGSVTTIPDSEGALAGTYTFKSDYYTDGSPKGLVYPRAGGLAPEKVWSLYTTLGAPSQLLTIGTEAAYYVTNIAYSGTGLLQRVERSLDIDKAKVWQTYSYEPGTNRLRKTILDRQLGTPNAVAETTYGYEDAGAISQITTKAIDATVVDRQCFTHDHLQRLTQAWTPAGDCANTPRVSDLAGPAPYWLNWTYDTSGNRSSQTQHTTSGDTTTTYTYPNAGGNQPHALGTATETTPEGQTQTGNYHYDPAGNTTQRPTPGGSETLTWDAEGHLDTTITADGARVSYLYDADGARLLRRDAIGTTAFLPSTDLRLDSSTGVVSATRFYALNGTIIASRTSRGLMWLVSDHQGTGEIALDAGTQKATIRRKTPFGTPRGAEVTWPTTRGFVGGENDPTGLVHLGAREYDPTTGRFVSVDPILDMNSPQQWNGYSYANNNPISSSDPTGLAPGWDWRDYYLSGYGGRFPRQQDTPTVDWREIYTSSYRDSPITYGPPSRGGSTAKGPMEVKSTGKEYPSCFVNNGTSCWGKSNPRKYDDPDRWEFYVPGVVDVAQELGLDPRQLLASMMLESEFCLSLTLDVCQKMHAAQAEIARPRTRATGVDASVGIMNMTISTFKSLQDRHEELGDLTVEDLIYSPYMSILSAGYLMKEVQDILPQRSEGLSYRYSEAEIVDFGYRGNPKAVMDVVERGLPMSPHGKEHVERFRNHWRDADKMICHSGWWTCSG